MSHTRREDLADVTRALADRNGLMDPARLKITAGPLVFDASDKADGLQALIRDYRPTVLRLCDPDVSPAHLATTNLGRINKVILPEALTKDFTAYSEVLGKMGFASNQDWVAKGIWVFERRSEEKVENSSKSNSETT